MKVTISTFLEPWHSVLNLTRQSPASWHTRHLAEEKEEFISAITFVEKLSEESDVFFTISRASFDGYPIATQPSLTASKRNMLVYAYMFGKFSSRCAFYQTAAILCRAEKWRELREVTNPGKNWKLRLVAERYDICPDKFKKMCQRLMKVWPLLP